MPDTTEAYSERSRQAQAKGQAQFYRKEAERLRNIATMALYGDLQADFLKMAKQYEILACQAEANIQFTDIVQLDVAQLVYAGEICVENGRAEWCAFDDTPNDAAVTLSRAR